MVSLLDLPEDLLRVVYMVGVTDMYYYAEMFHDQHNLILSYLIFSDPRNKITMIKSRYIDHVNVI